MHDLPFCVPSGMDVANALQAAEWNEARVNHTLGAWFWDEEQALLGLTLFVPSIYCENERLFNLLMSMGRRAQSALLVCATRRIAAKD